MITADSSYRGPEKGGTIAATFPDLGSANKALADLHHAGFRNVWLGVTQGDAATGAGLMLDSHGTFISGDGAQAQALHQALIARGLSDDQARRLEATVPPGATIVTVDGENNPDEALEIVQTNGGNVVAGASAKASRPDVDVARRLQLREERLLIDKQRVPSGEARIRKEVVSEEQSIDVPVFHEELFIQRRPVSEGAKASTTPIGEGEEIRIPLNEERVDVQKRTVVTEEVEIGKRKVEGTEHVSDTVRHEKLRVDDDATTKGDDPRLSVR
mgnify:CR=1 FL=1